MQMMFTFGNVQVKAPSAPADVTSPGDPVAVFTSNGDYTIGAVLPLNGPNFHFGNAFFIRTSADKYYAYIRFDAPGGLLLTGLAFYAMTDVPGASPAQPVTVAIEAGKRQDFADAQALGQVQVFNDPRNIAKSVAVNSPLIPGSNFIRFRATSPIPSPDNYIAYFSVRLEYNIFPPAPVRQLFGALPPDGANPIGKAARAVIVGRMKSETPGAYTIIRRTSEEKVPYKDAFFPGRQPDPEEANVMQYVGTLRAGFMSGLAVATLCQGIYKVTSLAGTAVAIDKVNGDLAAMNQALRVQLTGWYAHMMSVVDGDIQVALKAFPDSASRQDAKVHYINGLTSEAWLNRAIVMEQQGLWVHPEWELYHHWVKLLALGATNDEINGVIGALAAKGLTIPASVGASTGQPSSTWYGQTGPGGWLAWNQWFGDDIGAADVADANGNFLKDVSQYLAAPPYIYTYKEGYACGFILKGAATIYSNGRKIPG